MITLRTILLATLQQVFDQAVAHLRQQNSKALDDTACVYRAQDGKKCAAGAFIGDDEYSPEMENKTIIAGGLWNILKEKFPDTVIPDTVMNTDTSEEREKLNRRDQITLLRDFQNIHDNREVNQWEHEFYRVAQDWGLVYTQR